MTERYRVERLYMPSDTTLEEFLNTHADHGWTLFSIFPDDGFVRMVFRHNGNHRTGRAEPQQEEVPHA